MIFYMCGITGYLELSEKKRPDYNLIGRMVQSIRHRGPDEFGAFFDGHCAFGHARLSIIDLSSGQQPMTNNDRSLWICYNGEIYNYLELRKDLEKLGHRFKTQSDTEVIIHSFEQWGNDCLARFNGQFAFAIYNRDDKTLMIARDRLGIRPLFFTQIHDRFYFASEIKALFCDPTIPRKIDLKGLDEIFTWWTTAPPRTAFENISELEAGCYVTIQNGSIRKHRYWSIDFPETFDTKRSAESFAEELHERLVNSVRLRLRADVPVGAYLSGGLDSSATTSLIKYHTDTKVESFSVGFEDSAFDETSYQQQMADYLGTSHHAVKITYNDIADNFPEVIHHTERPILRTAPTPLFILSRLVRKHNLKVVLTGEGSDEIFGGYDIFKETLIRRFWARQPESKMRPLLLQRLYPTLPISGARAQAYLERFYKSGFEEIDTYYFSHIPRIKTTTEVKNYFNRDTQNNINGHDAISVFGYDLPKHFNTWHHLLKAQYVESRSLLSGYLLSSQGDRVASAHSVEGRFPFLDHELVEFASSIPPLYKIHGLNEKYILKKAMRKELPESITNRVKQPYMAPDANSFTQPDSPPYVSEALSEQSIKEAGIFNPEYVNKLYSKCLRMGDRRLSFKDNMSFIGILSTQLLSKQFITSLQSVPTPERSEFKVWVDISD